MPNKRNEGKPLYNPGDERPPEKWQYVKKPKLSPESSETEEEKVVFNSDLGLEDGDNDTESQGDLFNQASNPLVGTSKECSGTEGITFYVHYAVKLLSNF